jgi:hypothetical protein
VSHPQQPDPETPLADPQPDPATLLAERDEQINRLQLENQRARVSHETGIPEDMLTGATTPEQVDEIAGALLGWRLTTAPEPAPPPTAAVSVEFANGVGALGAVDRAALNPRYRQIQTRDSLSRMSPAEILSAWRAGYLTQIGIGAPQPSGLTPLTRRAH